MHCNIILTNVLNEETVYQSSVLINGYIKNATEGTINASVNNSDPVVFKVKNGEFKCLAMLTKGKNILHLTFMKETLNLTLYYQVSKAAPLKLCILVAVDSDFIYDAPNTPTENGLLIVKQKLVFAARTWQAFIANQMHTEGLGRRSFNLEYDEDNDTQISTYVIRTSKTKAELRDLFLAQQYQRPEKIEPEKSLFEIFIESLKNYGHPFDKECYVAGLILDSKWDIVHKIVRAHAALGGGMDNIRVGIFGSHFLYAAPKDISEFSRCIDNPLRIDTQYVSNEGVDNGKHCHMYSIGTSAFLHEVGHCFDLDHSPDGIMGSCFKDFNKNFLSTYNNRYVKQCDVRSRFMRIDLLKLRLHSCFKLPSDVISKQNNHLVQYPRFCYNEEEIKIFYEDGISLTIVASNEIYQTHDEFITMPKDFISYRISDILNHLEGSNGQKINFTAYTTNGHRETLCNIEKLKHKYDEISKNLIVPFYMTNHFGSPQSHAETKIIYFDNNNSKTDEIFVYSGDLVDGLEVKTKNIIAEQCGGKGGHLTKITLDEFEYIKHINIRSGFLVDAIQFVTTKNTATEWLGGRGGGLRVIKPLEDYKLYGLVVNAQEIIYSIEGIFVKK